MTFSITNATARLPWFDENFLSNFKLCLDLASSFFCKLQGSASIWRIQQPYLNSSFCATALHCTAQPHGMYLRLWFWFNFCHFNFSWALFSFHFSLRVTVSQVLNFMEESSLNINFLSTFFISIYAFHFIDIFTVSKNQSNQALFSWNFCENTSGIFIKLQDRWRKLSFIFCRLKRWKNDKADEK